MKNKNSLRIEKPKIAMETGLFLCPPGTTSVIMDPGLGVRWNFGLTLAGTVEDIREAGRTIFKKGSFHLMKPGARHGWRVPQKGPSWQVVWFIFDPLPEWLPLLNLPEIAPGHSLITLEGLPEEKQIRNAFLEAHNHLIDQSSPMSPRLACNALERGLLWINAAHTRAIPSDKDARITLAMRFMRRRLSEKITLSDIAKSAGLSTSRLLTLFKQHVNLAPMEYLERERLRRAGELLAHSGFSIKEIAAQCGYSHQRYFATRFKSVTGTTPTQVRHKKF